MAASECGDSRQYGFEFQPMPKLVNEVSGVWGVWVNDFPVVVLQTA